MEGVVLYIVLVKVFIQINWKYYVSFTLLSYGKISHMLSGSRTHSKLYGAQQISIIKIK